MKPAIEQPRLSWNLIKEAYYGEWVELTDCKWEWSSPTPKLARIRNFSSDRSELMKRIEKAGNLNDAVVLYVGATTAPVPLNAEAATA